MYRFYCLPLKYSVHGMYMIKAKIMINNNNDNESERYQVFFLTTLFVNLYILNM